MGNENQVAFVLVKTKLEEVENETIDQSVFCIQHFEIPFCNNQSHFFIEEIVNFGGFSLIHSLVIVPPF